MKLQNRVALVTGAGKGIGKAIALALAQEGAHLVVAARTVEEVKATAAEVRCLGQRALAHTCDITRWEEVHRLADAARSEFGRVDILVNNAGRRTPIGPLATSDPEEWLASLAVNLGGVFTCCRAVLPIMIRQRAGKIINLSGGGATSPSPNFSAYGIAKAGVVRLTETLAEEVKDYNIQVNAIAPGAVYTAMTEDVIRAGKDAGERALTEALQVKEAGGTPLEEVAALAVFLASEEANGLTGRLISVRWDPWRGLTPARMREIARSDLYTLRRVVPEHQEDRAGASSRDHTGV